MRKLILGIVVGLAAGLVIQGVRFGALRQANQQLQRDVSELQRQVAEREQSAAPGASAAMTEEERGELLRLRNQAAQLRTATNELQRLRAQAIQLGAPAAQTTGVPSQTAGAATGEAIPRESWSFAGYATPEAAVQSLMFGMSQGNYDVALASLTPDEAGEETRNKTPEQLREQWLRDTARISTYRILDRDEISAEETVLMVYATGEKKAVLPMKMKKVGEEWKFAGMVTD